MTRTALPEDDSYIIKLGISLYSFASVTTFLIENICHLDPNLNRQELEKLPAGKIVGELEQIQVNRKPDKITADIQFVIDQYSIFKDLRNDILHSYCITGRDGKQVLYRKNNTGSFEVDELFLDNFISNFMDINDRLYKIRDFAWGIK